MVKIVNCNVNIIFKIFSNEQYGIYFLGEGGCNLENTKIYKNKGAGVKVGPINKVKIMKNEIRENTLGIESNNIKKFYLVILILLIII